MIVDTNGAATAHSPGSVHQKNTAGEKAQHASPMDKLQPSSVSQAADFKAQLAAMVGTEKAEENQANRFNERGFFRNVSVDFDHALQSDAAGNTTSRIRSWTAEETAIAKADVAQAFSKLDEAGLREYFSSRLGSPRAGIKVGGPTISPNPPGKVPLVQNTPMIAKLVSSSSESRQGLGVAPQSQQAANAKGAEEQSARAQISRQLQSQVEMADLMLQASAQRKQGPVRLALRELDTGLQLVAEINGMERTDQDEVRSVILSLLAQHGLGNYNLWLNGQQFANRIIDKGGA